MKLKKNWVKIVLFVLGVVILAVAAYICLPKILQLLGFLVKLFLPFLLGYLFSMAVNPLADTLQKRLKIPRGLSAVLVIVLIVGIFGGVLTFAIWKIVDEGRMLYEMGDATFCLGNVFESNYQNVINNGVCRTVCASSMLETLPSCCDCVYQQYCGTCPVVNYAGSADVIEKSPRGYRCKIYTGILDFIFEQFLKDEKIIMNVFDKWRC